MLRVQLSSTFTREKGELKVFRRKNARSTSGMALEKEVSQNGAQVFSQGTRSRPEFSYPECCRSGYLGARFGLLLVHRRIGSRQKTFHPVSSHMRG